MYKITITSSNSDRVFSKEFNTLKECKDFIFARCYSDYTDCKYQFNPNNIMIYGDSTYTIRIEHTTRHKVPNHKMLMLTSNIDMY